MHSSCKLSPPQQIFMRQSALCAPACVLSLQHASYALIRRGVHPLYVQAASPFVCADCRYNVNVFTFCFRLVPSLPPQDIEIQNSSSTSILVQWKPIPKNHVNGILLGIKLLYRSAPRDNSIVFSTRARRSTEEDWSEYTIITLHPSALSYKMTSLKKFTNYSVSILGFTSKGDGNVSQQFVASTDEDGQYDGVDIFQMLVILVDCARTVSCLSSFAPRFRREERKRTSIGERRSISFASRLCWFTFFPADIGAKERH